ncbi:Malate dehydrogenase, mitochondrial [Neolecta irregularis DAH-3]|uniref:Malate dehydrogenase n=1 Tax=Neolecta irregularis (strain DAH-3) TaxID=1198029 RepID=A0A1U7LIK0_NEOID|nr:Malate dehydrogenase, mitochondrial [Neolecta irregularis DAH-3]|eukprot:OLL22477.1 Malate dehydrogenase, mitochondrial [Neolecta irregularis DAH-3]
MMFSRLAVASITKRQFSHTVSNATKIAVLGAAGGIGQPLSLLLKLNPFVSDLALYDIHGAPGVGADLCHIDTKSTVKGYLSEYDGLQKTLDGAEVVVIPAGVPRKPGMTRDDLFKTNASIVRDLAKAAAQHCPTAHILVISNPVNSTVPIVAEVFKKFKVYDPKKLFGVTTLDLVRARRFVSELRESDPASEELIVIGGHSGHNFEGQELDNLCKRVQFGGDEVVRAKGGAGSATLSMAHAAAQMTNSLLEAMSGKSGVVQCSFVQSDLYPECAFFSSQVELGQDGVEKVRDIGKINEYEENMLKVCRAELAKNIEKGKTWIAANWE